MASLMQSRLPAHNSQKRWMVLGGLGMLVVAVGLFMYFGAEIRANERKTPKGPPAIPVTVEPVVQQVVPFRIQAIGNVEAYSTVAVKARVDGQIVEVGFKEGEEVKKGQILFKIDPRPYEAALRQAEANALRDTAAAEQARSQEKRYQDLLDKNFVSKEAYAQIRTNATTAEATARASQAALDNAKLNVEYCTITAPIGGYAGKIQIQLGNLVKANDVNALVVINQVHPSTGTIKLRAQFQNGENALWPGQFVNVRIKLYDQKDALVVPSRSVQTGPNGQYVFVVKPDMTTEVRKVTVERTEGDSAIVATGLEKGERVVTQGQLRLGAGAKVAIKS